MNIAVLIESIGVLLELLNVYFLEFILVLCAGFLGMISSMIVCEKNTLLGEQYGKTSFLGIIAKYLLLLLAICAWAFLYIVFLYHFITHFFENNTLSEIGEVLIHIILLIVASVLVIPMLWRFGVAVGTSKRDKKYKNQIDRILMNNPIFVAALEKAKSGEINMVKVYRDGISFHKNAMNSLPPCEEITFHTGAVNKREAEKILYENATKLIDTVGTVAMSNGDSKLLYADYGYADSETAMNDISNYLADYLKPKFIVHRYEKQLKYHEILCSGPTGAIVSSNGIITPTGQSSDIIEAYEHITLMVILVVETPKEEMPDKIQW